SRTATLPAFASAGLSEWGDDRSSSTQAEFGISLLAASSFVASRAARMTRAPALASARAHASPMPRLAPVTRAVLFVIVLIMAYEDLREFVRALEKNKELKRISLEVNPDLEITEFADRSVTTGDPALLFEKPKDSKITV